MAYPKVRRISWLLRSFPLHSCGFKVSAPTGKSEKGTPLRHAASPGFFTVFPCARACFRAIPHK